MSSSYQYQPYNLSLSSNITNTNQHSSNNTPRSINGYSNDQNSNKPYSEYQLPKTPLSTGYGQISNDLYTQNSPKARMNGDTSNKLNQMSTDLTKLKQQLSKIMSQTDRFQKKTNTKDRPIHHQQLNQNTSQSFQKQENTKNWAAFNINTNENYSKEEKQMVSSLSSKLLPQKDKISSQVTNFKNPHSNNFYLNSSIYSDKKLQKIQNTQSQKTLNFSSRSYTNSGNQRIKLPQQEQIFKKIEEKSNQQLQINSRGNDFKTSIYKGQFTKTSSGIESSANNSEQKVLIPSLKPTFIKKSSSNISHQLIVSKIVNQQLNRKIQSSFQAQQLRKKKQEQQMQFQQKIIELEHQKRKLKHQLNSSVLQRENISSMLQTEKSQKEALFKKYSELQQILRTPKVELEEYKSRCRLLQRKLQNEITRPKTSTGPINFDEALKQQFSQIKKYKEKLEQKDQQIFRIKDLNTIHRREIQSLHNQIKIEQLKAASQVNECDLKHSTIAQDKDNEIKTLKNLISTIEVKLDIAVKENKTKDAFMVQHLTGKVKTEQQKVYVQNFFKKYQVQFPSNKLGQKIRQEQLQIAKLKKTILQMATININ